MEPCRLFRRIAALFTVVVFVFTGLLVFGFLALLFVEDLPPCEQPAKRQIAADEPLYPVQIKGQWGFIDRQGELVLPPMAESAKQFQGPTAAVVNFGCANVLSRDFLCPIDMWPWNWRRLVSFAICLGYQGHLFDRWWLVDRGGHRQGGKRFNFIGDYGDGLYPVNHGGSPNQHGFMTGGKWGYIDQRGELVIPYRYDDAEPFSDGLAQVRVGQQWFFVDRQGKTVAALDPTLCKDGCQVLAFTEGLALVEWYGRSGD